MELRRSVLSPTMLLAAWMLMPLSVQAEGDRSLGLLTAADTPLREKERIGFIGDSITMQGGFIRLMREAIGQSDHTKDLSVQLFQHGLNGGRVDTIVEGVTPWGKQGPLFQAARKGQTHRGRDLPGSE